MPSIKDLFGPVTDDEGWNLDDFMNEANAAADESAERQHLMGGNAEPVPGSEPAPIPPPEPASGVAGEGVGTPGAGDGTVPPEPAAGVPAEPIAPPPPPADPLLALPEARRRELYALDAVMNADPTVRERIAEVIRPAAPEAPPAPQLPAHIDPESVEAQLWTQNQEILSRLDRQDADRQRQQMEQAEHQRHVAAAQHAGAAFRARYPGLTDTDMQLLAPRVANGGLPQALAAQPGTDLISAYDRALEYEALRDPEIRARVGGVASSTPAPLTPPGPTPQGEANKRKLHSISGAGSPVAGPPPQKTALETRADGSLTPQSKSLLVEETAARLRNASN